MQCAHEGALPFLVGVIIDERARRDKGKTS
jgi:hypothetical protein